MIEKRYIESILKNEKIERLKKYNLEVWILSSKQKDEKRKITKKTKKKLSGGKHRRVFIYLSDDSGKVPSELLRQKNLVFKCHTGETEKENLHHFPIGFPNYKIEEKKVEESSNDRYLNVFFAGNLNNRRLALHGELIGTVLPYSIYQWFAKRGEGPRTDLSFTIPDSIIQFNREWAGGMQPSEYQQTMRRSKIALCPPGFLSNETFRHFEALRAGCAVISERLPPSNPFYQTSAIIQVDSAREMVARARELLSNEGRLKHLMQLSRRWWERKCSPEAVAEYVYEKAISYYGG
jgi:hypothetical protein